MKIEWQNRAKVEWRKLILYCLREFGRFTTLRFQEKINKSLSLLQVFPHMGKVESELTGKEYEYRSFVVHEHFKMIYRWDEERDTIYIIHFWDVRREPQTLKEETEFIEK